MTLKDIRIRALHVLEPSERPTTAGRVFGFFIMSLIILNVIAVITQTIPEAQGSFSRQFQVFEIFSVAVFTVEYVVRLWCIVELPEFSAPLMGRLRYARTPRAIIDLLAILPFYLPFTGALDLRALRALRLFRLVRILKVGRYSETVRLFGAVLLGKREELILVAVVLVILTIISSSLMYFAENTAQPDAFSSIPAAMWWSVVTMTTVGYGDVCPHTVLGKVIGSIVAILGIGMFALPAGILGAGFLEEIRARRGPRKCPHCGKDL